MNIPSNDRRPCALLLVMAVLVIGIGSQAPHARAQTPPSLDEQEKEIDRQQMRQIHEAIMSYKADHDTLPDWLSDLVPKYISDAQLLVSPRERRTGISRLWGYADPKIKTSYVYEFSANQAGSTVNRNRDEPISMREWKSLQMEEFGPAIPLLRCHLYPKVLNLAYSGDAYETELFWENDPATLALVEKLGPGDGSPEAKYLTLTVQTASGEPIPNVDVTASERESEYFHLPPVKFTTDEAGTCQVRLGRGIIKSVAIGFRADGYAAPPIRFEGGEGIFVPDQHTVTMSRTTVIGGLVAGRDGTLLSDAEITVNGTTQDAAGQYVEFEFDRIRSDAAGQWRSSRVPQDFSSLTFAVSHPEFRPSEYFQTDEDEASDEEVSRRDLIQNEARFVLDPGISIRGTISSPSGHPVVGARITLQNNDEPPATETRLSQPDGSYRFVVMEESQFNLVVESKDFSPQHRIINATEDLPEQSFDLAPGRKINGQVTDKDGKPIDGAFVRVLSWNDLPLIQWSTETDREGHFSWSNVPTGMVILEVSKAGFNQSQLTLGDNSSPKILLSKTFLLTGSVVDADTGEPIPEFTVVRGRAWGGGATEQVSWEFHTAKTGRDGRLSVEQDPRRPTPFGMNIKYLISAKGYLPETSDTIQSSGWHKLDFRLMKGRGPHGKVTLPDGSPAIGAEVVLLGAGHSRLGVKELIQRGPPNPNTTRTDEDGGFELPAAIKDLQVVAIHEKGFAEIADFDPNQSLDLHLQPWGRVEGTLLAGTKPWANQEVMVSNRRLGNSSGLDLDFQVFKVRTNEVGEFSIDNVPPGERQLVLLVELGEGQNRSWAHSHIEPIDVHAGRPTKVVYGNKGRPIIGRFKFETPNTEVDWNNGHRTLGTKQIRRPQGLSPEEYEEWNQKPEVIKSRQDYRYYSFKIADDGTFRIENIPAGEYILSLHLNKPGAERFQFQPIASHRQDLIIPAFDGTVSDEPYDIGEITLQMLPLEAGQIRR